MLLENGRKQMLILALLFLIVHLPPLSLGRVLFLSSFGRRLMKCLSEGMKTLSSFLQNILVTFV